MSEVVSLNTAPWEAEKELTPEKLAMGVWLLRIWGISLILAFLAGMQFSVSWWPRLRQRVVEWCGCLGHWKMKLREKWADGDAWAQEAFELEVAAADTRVLLTSRVNPRSPLEGIETTGSPGVAKQSLCCHQLRGLQQ